MHRNLENDVHNLSLIIDEYNNVLLFNKNL